MRLIKILLLLIFFSIQLGCLSQKSDTISMHKRDELLVSIYDKFYENRHDYGASYGEARDTILFRFRQRLRETLHTPEAISYDFPLLSKRVDIVHSKNKKLRIFSWDELNGGTWKIFNSMYQYQDKDSILVGDLSSNNKGSNGFRDVTYYDIKEVKENRYLIFGYGTHGGGKDFFLIRLLDFENNTISDCDKCFNEKDELVFSKPRVSKDKPIFNQVTRTLLFPEYKENEETGFLYKTNDTLFLKYENGIFIKN